ncbi:MAG: TA system VapC family ribonuclease toxin, partial [Gemmatimonadales bacterium]
MSFALDVNVLLYASDESSPKHARAREFLERCAAGPEMMCLAWITLFAYLRMATHPRIFERPLSPRAAEANVEALIELPHVRTLAEEQGFWTHYREVTGDMHARRNQVPD